MPCMGARVVRAQGRLSPPRTPCSIHSHTAHTVNWISKTDHATNGGQDEPQTAVQSIIKRILVSKDQERRGCMTPSLLITRKILIFTPIHPSSPQYTFTFYPDLRQCTANLSLSIPSHGCIRKYIPVGQLVLTVLKFRYICMC